MQTIKKSKMKIQTKIKFGFLAVSVFALNQVNAQETKPGIILSSFHAG